MLFNSAAFVVFLLVRQINRFYPRAEPPKTTKECEFCAMEIPLKATRCGHCTSPVSPASAA